MSSCFAVLRQIRSIRRSVSQSVLQSLVVSLVLSRLDYGSATLAGLPVRLLDRLQSVLNAAARLVYGCRKYDHVTPHIVNMQNGVADSKYVVSDDHLQPGHVTSRMRIANFAIKMVY